STRMHSKLRRLGVVAAAGVALLATAQAAAQKVLQLPIRTDGPKSLDPVAGSTTYDNMACAQMYETLLIAKYSDPYKIEPLLLAEMPTSDDGGKTWNFRLKEGVMFHDDECFPGGKGRELVTDDVFYSLLRIFDAENELKNEWLLKDTILGLDAYAAEQNASDLFDYDGSVPGFVKIDDHNFQIILEQPVYRFLYVLAMFQTSIVPREAVEFHGDRFAFNPVGTGPFILDEWIPKKSLTADANPNYHEVLYPAEDEWTRDDRRNRLHRPAGQKVPFVDRIEFTMFVEDQPMWLRFQAGDIGLTQVPAEYFEQAFDGRTKRLLPEVRQRGVRHDIVPLLDFIFRGFNMEDELLGGYTPEKRALRQAIHLAIDLDEFSETFYQGNTIQYDGPIPPRLDGHPEGGTAPVSFRGPNLQLARQKLAEAGYPDGEGLPAIKFYTSRGGNNAEQVEMMKRQLAEVNINLQPELVDFSTLIEFTNNKKAPMFGFAWSSDYPDAENNLALFYSPNESPGSNHYNYKNPEFDALYEKILTMEPSEERTAIYERMRDMVIEDTPYIGSMARTRYYLINEWLLNAKPTERYYAWFKFLDVDDSKR
ncbi:MAG: ABC transporter substrate-binding protein, partial [Planctomycetota bacterium]